MSKSARILNISPKVQLQINDDRQGAYPTILRSSDQRMLGNDPSVFDDSTTQVFVDQNVLMPYNITGSLAKASGFLTGTISIVKTPSPASQFLTKFEEDTFKPFNESRNPSAFFSTSSDTYFGFEKLSCPGFTSKTNEQIAINIDITPKESIALSRVGTEFTAGNPHPGFYYYNFNTKTWDELGVTDPATGAVLDLSSSFIEAGASAEIAAGQQYIFRQFSHSPGISSSGSLYFADTMDNNGYDKIGYPTSVYGAPNTPRYHATSSQCLRLSDYIQHPFVLERVEVHFSVVATRVQGAAINWGASSFPEGFGRDIDNHVFFMYRQNRANCIKDSIQDVSSSFRSLIGNQSFCFYNANSLPLKLAGNPVPIHENGGEFDFNMSRTDTNQIKALNKNISLTFRPKQYKRMFTNVSAASIERKSQFFNTWVQNFWTGGTKNIDRTGTWDYKSTARAERDINYLIKTDADASPEAKIDYTDFQYDSRAILRPKIDEEINPVRQGSVYFENSAVPGYYYKVTSETETYVETPYILLPEDEIIFGIDTGFFTTLGRGALNAQSRTNLPPGYGSTSISEGIGPALGIYGADSQKEARVIFYGTLLKDGIEKLDYLNQNLTSKSIHEDVHEVIVDQLQISERLSYSGSYIDNYITGTMGDPANPRQVVHTATSGLAGDNFALEKFVTMQNFSFGNENAVLDVNTLSTIGLTPALKKLTTKNLVATFRHDRYGQFRDMLEQRIDSKGKETIYKSRNFPIPDFIKTFGSSSYSSPVVSIYTSQSSEVVVDPLGTRICNLSTESTASLPYFDDGVARNRSPIVFTANPPFEVETVILDKPSTLLSTS